MNAPDATVTRERAALDGQHIATLMKTDAFNDYFMRRLNQKIKAGEVSIVEDDMTPEKREELRQHVKAWKEIRRWVSLEEIASCQLAAGG